MVKEKDLYPIIMQKFSGLFKSKGYQIHLEITADKKFSNKLKSVIPDNQQIIFYFLKEVAPDITGFFKGRYNTYLVVIEVKDEKIRLDHIYQMKKYADLFGAKFAFLVSTEEIPEEIKRLTKSIYSILSTPSPYQARVLVYFDEEAQDFRDWHPENPFTQEYYW